MRRSTALSVLLIFAGCGGEDAPPAHAELEQFIRTEMTAGGFPGVAAAIIKGGEVKWTGVFGYADLEAHRLVDADTPFLVASISKTVLSVLLMQQVEQHKLALQDAVDGPLGFQVRDPGHEDSPITAEMLATHTSGLVDDWVTLSAMTGGTDSATSLHDFAANYVTPEHFKDVPGKSWSYCNAGFGILGAVVEGAAGEPLPDLSKRTVFEPLGMSNTTWLLRDTDLARAAVPYSGTYRDGFIRGEHQGFAFYPATSLRTSVVDLAKFLIAFMRAGDAGNGQRILQEATARAMRELQVPGVDEDQALVWYYEDIGGKRYLGHSGSAIGASALMFFRAEDDFGAILLTNSDAFLRSRLGRKEGSTALYAIVARMAEEPLP